MTVKLNFKNRNAAFVDNPGEVSRILREVADRIENGDDFGTIHDDNGASVGKYSVTKR